MDNNYYCDLIAELRSVQSHNYEDPSDLAERSADAIERLTSPCEWRKFGDATYWTTDCGNGRSIGNVVHGNEVFCRDCGRKIKIIYNKHHQTGERK